MSFYSNDCYNQLHTHKPNASYKVIYVYDINKEKIVT